MTLNTPYVLMRHKNSSIDEAFSAGSGAVVPNAVAFSTAEVPKASAGLLSTAEHEVPNPGIGTFSQEPSIGGGKRKTMRRAVTRASRVVPNTPSGSPPNPRVRIGVADLIGYVPPELKRNASGCYIDYYAKHPESGELKRMRIKLNRLKGKFQQLAYGRRLVLALAKKLETGWNPWQAPIDLNGEPRAVVTLRMAYEQWLRVKTKHTRHSSPYSYSSMGSVLLQWAEQHHT